ncbi:MAG: AI-2E family transporter [Clostridia bacterium]|nr:AI-2E family transporter [Clostridia bacterium]
MKKFFKEKTYAKWGLTAFVVIAVAILLNHVLAEWKYIQSVTNVVVKILRPILLGAAFAYLLNPLLKMYEKYIFGKLFSKIFKKNEKVAHKFKRAISIIFTFATALAVIAGLLVLIIPELYKNIQDMIWSFPAYVNNAVEYLTEFSEEYPEIADTLMQYPQLILDYINNWATKTLLPNASQLITNISLGIYGTFKALLDVVVGMIIAIYLLGSKEKYSAGVKKYLYALFERKTAYNIISIAKYTDNHFGKFIVGKILDSAIIGILSFVVFTIFDIPYTLLVSVIVGVTNVIPFFGPFLGAIPCGVLILLVNPVKALVFAILIFAIQQLDGNVIGPKILGDTTGLDSFAIVFAILVFGGFFGIFGMFIGVPVFATIFGIVNHACDAKLKKKNMPVDIKAYSIKGMVDKIPTRTDKEE